MKRLASLCLAAGSLAAAEGGKDARLADAAQRQDATAIRALIGQRADPNEPQIDGATALHWAAHQDDLAAAQALIGAGANVKAVNR